MDNETLFDGFAQTLKDRRDDHSVGFQVRKGTHEFVENLLAILFPHFSKEMLNTKVEIESRLILLERDLRSLLIPLLKETSLNLDDVIKQFMQSLPDLHNKLWLDAEAITSGDPAAESIDEVILAYPGFSAIAIYRIAHEFYISACPYFLASHYRICASNNWN